MATYDENRISDQIDGGLETEKQLWMNQSNGLIAEFDGGKFINDDSFMFPNGYYHFENQDNFSCAIEDLRYNECFDWLMPVVEKIIEFEDVKFTINGTFATIKSFDKVFKCHTVSLMNSLFGIVVQFIKHYNESQIIGKSNPNTEKDVM